MTETTMTTTRGGALTPGGLLREAGRAANRAASKHVFADYRDGKAANTIRAQSASLALFSEYLADVLPDIPTPEPEALASEPPAWHGVTWGLVAGFRKWMLERGYAVGAVNVRLSHVRVYAELAMKAGTIEPTENILIQAVNGYGQGEGANVDEKRELAGLGTRRGDKKSEPTHVNDRQAQQLKTEHASDGQGRRDRLLMCLLADWGPRVSELRDLRVENVDLDSLCPTLHLWRRKVKGTDAAHANLDLTTSPDTLEALRSYLGGYGAPTTGALFVGSTKRGNLTGRGMSIRAIHKRVTTLGASILGIENLTPHDLRHYAATYLGGFLSTRQLMDVFGWSSPAMATRYQKSAARVGRARSNADSPR